MTSEFEVVESIEGCEENVDAGAVVDADDEGTEEVGGVGAASG